MRAVTADATHEHNHCHVVHYKCHLFVRIENGVTALISDRGAIEAREFDITRILVPRVETKKTFQNGEQVDVRFLGFNIFPKMGTVVEST